jgi:hypothetical protein
VRAYDEGAWVREAAQAYSQKQAQKQAQKQSHKQVQCGEAKEAA